MATSRPSIARLRGSIQSRRISKLGFARRRSRHSPERWPRRRDMTKSRSFFWAENPASTGRWKLISLAPLGSAQPALNDLDLELPGPAKRVRITARGQLQVLAMRSARDRHNGVVRIHVVSILTRD